MTPRYLWMRPILGTLITLGFLGLTGWLSYKILDTGLDNVSGELLILFGAAVQALILMVKDGFAFYFGSSQGSANKADTLDRILNNDEPTPPEE